MVLTPLALSVQGMFEPYLKSFYIRSTDPTQIKILKVSPVLGHLVCIHRFHRY